MPKKYTEQSLMKLNTLTMRIAERRGFRIERFPDREEVKLHYPDGMVENCATYGEARRAVPNFAFNLHASFILAKEMYQGQANFDLEAIMNCKDGQEAAALIAQAWDEWKDEGHETPA